MILLLIPLYALADAYAGGSLLHSVSSRIPGRAVFWAALVLAGVGWLLCGLFGALAALAWFIWRTPAWSIFGGSTDPKGAKEFAGTLLRHLIAVPPLALAAYWGDRSIPMTALNGVAFALVATLLACAYAVSVKKAKRAGRPIGRQNTFVEVARGAAFGLAAIATWTHPLI